MTEQKFCEWCGQPTAGGAILCPSCHGTQQQVERGELQFNPPQKRSGAGYIVMQILKAGAAALLSLIALGVGLLGTCTFIGGVAGGGPWLLGMALLALGFATLLIWLIYMMYRADLKTTKPIRPPAPQMLPPPPPPADQNRIRPDNDQLPPSDAGHSHEDGETGPPPG